MSRLEFALVRMWGRFTERLVIVGDPAQALYAWRGADPMAFFDAPAKQEVLSQSYRVPRAVHEVATRIIARSELPKFDYQPRDADGKVWHFDHTTLADPHGLSAMLEQGILNHKTCMILTACNYQTPAITNYLRSLGIMFHNPYRASNNGWNPLNGARPLQAFLSPERHPSLWTYTQLNTWVKAIEAKGILRRGAKDDINTEARLGDAVPTVEQLLGWFEEPALHKAMDLDVDWLKEHLVASYRKRANLMLAFAMTKRDRHAIFQAPTVIVGTIHSVKGGESDYVAIFPDLSQKGIQEYLNGDRDSIIRQFYVGVTRAREALFLCGPSNKQPVRFW